MSVRRLIRPSNLLLALGLLASLSVGAEAQDGTLMGEMTAFTGIQFVD